MTSEDNYTHNFVLSSRSQLAEQGAWIGVTFRLHPEQREALKQDGEVVPEVELNVPALIDTGATGTCVDDQIAKDLGLMQIDVTNVGGVLHQKVCPVYMAEIQLGPWREPWKVVGLASEHSKHIPCLLGRDILQFFSFFYLGPEDRFVLYHGVPPLVQQLTAGGKSTKPSASK